MALKTYTAKAELIEGLKVRASARDFSVVLDEPLEQGGTNAGMNPIELALCSVCACQTITAAIFADFYGILVDDIKVEAEGGMDPDGFSGMDPDARPGIQKIHFRFMIKSRAPRVQVEELVKAVERMCPVGDSFRRGVELEAPELILSE